MTLYRGEDAGLDAERSDAALETVAAWRRRRRPAVPLPVGCARAEELRGTLDYPPEGSVDRTPGDPGPKRS